MRFTVYLIAKRLKEAGIEFDKSKIADVFHKYHRLLNVVSEKIGDSLEERYDFMYRKYKDFGAYNKTYFSIFVNCMKMEEKGLWDYLDYALLVDKLDNMHSSIFEVEWFLNKFVGWYDGDIDKWIDSLQFSNNHLMDEVWKNKKEAISKSKYLSDEYKKVMKSFFDLLEECEEVDYESICKIDHDYFFMNDFINCIYFYFLSKKILINDLERADKFLEYVLVEMEPLMDKIAFIGARHNKDVLQYIDALYERFDQKENLIR